MNSTAVDVHINTDPGNQLSLQLQILLIIVPIVLVPLASLISWYIRGHFADQNKILTEHRDAKRKYTITRLGKQIKTFYWPLYLLLLRYKQLSSRYKEFKAGNFTLSSHGDTRSQSVNLKIISQIMQKNNTGDNQDINTFVSKDNQNINIEMVEIEETHPIKSSPIEINRDIRIDIHSQSQIDIPSLNEMPPLNEIKQIDQDNRSDSSQRKNIDLNAPIHAKTDGLGFNESIKIINKFNRAITEYEDKMTEALRDAQKIYTEFAPLAEPGIDFLRELMKLDEYITYITAFRDLSDNDSGDIILEEKITKAKFPENVFTLIEDKLHYLQSMYNDLVYNHNSSVLDADYNPTENENANVVNTRAYRLSQYRSQSGVMLQSHPIS